MGIAHLRNITISQFETFLDLAKCNYIGTKGGHLKYSRCDLTRPIIFQSHQKPIPEFIIKNNLRVLGYSKDQFWDILEGRLLVERIGKEKAFELKKV